MKRTISIVGTLVAAFAVNAQAPPGSAEREAMKKLAFLAGKWSGDATVQVGADASIKLKQTEDVQFKLDGIVLLVEGTGVGRPPKTDKEGVVFNALATINYDVEAKKYRMRAINMEGQAVEPDVTVTENGIVWEFTPPKSKVRIRYTANVTRDSWVETGEVTLDGKSWRKFLEMNLKRVKD